MLSRLPGRERMTEMFGPTCGMNLQKLGFTLTLSLSVSCLIVSLMPFASFALTPIGQHAPSTSANKGPPKKGTWDDLVARCPIGVSAKDAKGISETIRQLTERLCTRRDNVLSHDTKWIDLKRSEARNGIALA
ncbi:hypothetical protein ABBQ32_010410 [Trebouxia sp. C0010 RCD-2024]